MKQSKVDHGSQTVRAKDNLELSYAGPSQGQSLGTNGLKLYVLAVIDSEG